MIEVHPAREIPIVLGELVQRNHAVLISITLFAKCCPRWPRRISFPRTPRGEIEHAIQCRCGSGAGEGCYRLETPPLRARLRIITVQANRTWRHDLAVPQNRRAETAARFRSFCLPNRFAVLQTQ